MNYYLRLLIEASVVGIICFIVGAFIFNLIIHLNTKCNYKLKFNNIVYLSMIISGIFVHLLFELLGGNKWYCENGMACQ